MASLLKPAKGYALVSVMLMTFMASVVVVGSLKDSYIQERLVGNFAKKVHARLTAELGVTNAREVVEEIIKDAPYQTMEQFVESLANKKEQLSGSGKITDSSYAADYTIDGDIITIKTAGSQYEGKDTLTAVFKFVPGTKVALQSPFATGLTGCDGVALGGSGAADSYNSKNGAYGATYIDEFGVSQVNTGDSVTVRTVSEVGRITIKGGADIKGDVIATSSVIFGGSASISGDLSTNGFVDITSAASYIGGKIEAFQYVDIKNTIVGGGIQANGTVTLSETKVGGDVISGSDVDITGEYVNGGVYAEGDMYLRNMNVLFAASGLTYGAQTYGDYYQSGGTVKGGVRALGNVNMPNWGTIIDSDDLRYGGVGYSREYATYALPPYKTSPDLIGLDNQEPLEQIPFDDGVDSGSDDEVICDPLDIATHIESVNSAAENPPSLFVSGSGSGDIYELGALQAKFLRDANSGSRSEATTISSTSASFLNEYREVLMFNDVEIKGHLRVADNSDVVVFVKGNFSMGGQSSLTIPDGSTLTFIIKGTFDVGAGGQVYTPDTGLNDDGVPIFSIYSDFDGDGISISGGTENIYAAVYAPYTNVSITSSSDFLGSILGKTVSVTGSGAFHYDAYLGEAIVGPDPNKSVAGKFQFLGFQFLGYQDSGG